MGFLKKGSTLAPKLKIGVIDFVNVSPVVAGLSEGRELWELVKGPPKHLNQLLRSKELDLAIASSVEYLRDPNSYWILKGVGLGAGGKVGSVVLLSEFPMKKWHKGVIECTRESETSVFLLEILLSRCWGIRVDLAEEGTVETPVARLRIGDRALEEMASQRWTFFWDLGEVWSQWTGLPFVFALWLVREEVLEEKPDLLEEAYRNLKEASRQASTKFHICAKEAATKLKMEGFDFLNYFLGLDYFLEQSHWEGLMRFASELSAQGKIAHIPPLRFWPP